MSGGAAFGHDNSKPQSQMLASSILLAQDSLKRQNSMLIEMIEEFNGRYVDMRDKFKRIREDMDMQDQMEGEVGEVDFGGVKVIIEQPIADEEDAKTGTISPQHKNIEEQKNLDKL